jgi:SsrA-binding protein
MKITNRKAYHEYTVLQDFTAGIILLGSEVKSIRLGNVTISDSYLYLKDGEIWTKNLIIGKYKQTHLLQTHDEKRDKKLLLNRREINRIEKLLQDNGTTIVPLEIFLKNNRIKIKIGVVHGKRQFDKRETIKKRETERDIRRVI